MLYVDDEQSNCTVFELTFKQRFRVLTCTSGAAAIELLKANPGQVGVLVTDQRMPGMSGSELLAQARELSPETQRMVVTAFSDMTAVFDAVNRGQVQRYFVKPWSREDLGAAIAAALDVFELHNRLRSVQERLLTSERLSVIGQVSAGIAHELMSPVGALAANVHHLRLELEPLLALARKGAGPTPAPEVASALDDLPELVSEIAQAVDHIGTLARSVRNQARGEDADETCDFAEVAQFAARLTRIEVQRCGRLFVTGSKVMVRAGQVKLTQVLINLVVNAAQAMAESNRRGTIELGWEDRGPEGLVAWVKDQGPGIAPENLSRIFEPLFTTRPAGVGTGLGLSICKDIVEHAGGSLTVESTPGAGATFFIRLRTVH